MTDFAIQRKAMVDSQVRPSDVTDRRIPRAMLAVEREAFVPQGMAAIAYMDEALRLPGGRSLLAPRVLAKMLQHLDVSEQAVALDVGGCTGYSAAILAQMAQRVVAVEVDAELSNVARHVVPASNVRHVTGSLPAGAAAEGPYDVILLNGAVAEAPRALLDQLKDGGRLAAILADGRTSRAVLWQRFAMQFDHRILFDAGAAILPGFERKAEFVF